jgi:hypothetical protein
MRPVSTNTLEYNKGSNVMIKELWWQKKGLSYTASGYGKRIPTRYMVEHNGRWYRVYCCIFGATGTLFIESKGEDIIVDINFTPEQNG